MGWFLVFFLIFWVRGALFLDPDFGWHYKLGEYILSSGIPYTDPFSYTMPSYYFVDHEWLTNILFFVLPYSVLAMVCGLLAAATIYISIWSLSKKIRVYQLIPLILVGVTLYGIVGVRPQVISWFLFALLLLIIRSHIYFSRWIWFLPFLILAWVNLHGSFPLGIVVIMLASWYWWTQSKVSFKKIVTLVGLSLGATVLNPYGFRIWWEVWMQMSDGSLRFMIQEWTPAILLPHGTFWLFAAISWVLVWQYRKRFSLLDMMLYVSLFLATISSIRHMAFWFIIALPMTMQGISMFSYEVSKLPEGQRRLKKASYVLVVFISLFSLFTLWPLVTAFGNKETMYPEKAVGYLKSHPSEGQVFATYDWGGYLIWQLPEKKVFIDGRMPSWRWQENFPKESKYAFKDYQNFLTGKTSFSEIIEKYDIRTILVPQEGNVSADPLAKIVVSVGRDILHLPPKENKTYTFVLNQAMKYGWEKVYEDNTAVVYQKL